MGTLGQVESLSGKCSHKQNAKILPPLHYMITYSYNPLPKQYTMTYTNGNQRSDMIALH